MKDDREKLISPTPGWELSMGLKTWFIATRPWSFVMTMISVSFAAILSYERAGFDILLYVITLVGLIIFHAATNMINDYFDVKHGVDKPDAPTARYRPHPLLTGSIERGNFLASIAILYLIVFAIAFYLTLLRGYIVMLLTLSGFLFSVFYTSDPIIFKHRAFGEIAVFLVWGPLIVGGSYYVISGDLSFKPFLASIPIGILVALVLLANNLRDAEYDASVDVITIVTKLGREAGLKLYRALFLLTYITTAILIGVGMLSLWCFIVFLTVPKAKSLIDLFKEKIPDAADPLTSQVLLYFGILLIIGELINLMVPLKIVLL